jgi:3-hydroxyacyl-[acyl-carrier-protein] dehydratase
MPSVTNDLFSIDKISHEDAAISVILSINTGSEILKGHFPGHPVVPGACMLQIVKEVLQIALNHPVRQKKADQLKFMIMIDPTNTLAVALDMTYKYSDDDTIVVTAKLSNPDALYFKFQGSFVRA